MISFLLSVVYLLSTPLEKPRMRKFPLQRSHIPLSFRFSVEKTTNTHNEPPPTLPRYVPSQTQAARTQVPLTRNSHSQVTDSLPLYLSETFSPYSLRVPEPTHGHTLSRQSSISSIASTTTTTTMHAGYKCPLCFSKRTDLSSAPCGHVYCTLCIMAAIECDPRCPMCRRETTQGNLRTVYLGS